MAQLVTNYLQEAAATPFAYGQDDCASFAFGWFDRLTGKNALASWRGRYCDAASCIAYIHRHGGSAAIAGGFLGDHYGATRCLPKPGNAVLVRFKGAEIMGLRVDDRSVALRTERGIAITRRAEVIDEWGLA